MNIILIKFYIGLNDTRSYLIIFKMILKLLDNRGSHQMTDLKISTDLPELLCVSDEIIICGGKKSDIVSSATLSIVTTSKMWEVLELSGGVEYLTDHICYITHIVTRSPFRGDPGL
jgi:hypothetical protein